MIFAFRSIDRTSDRWSVTITAITSGSWLGASEPTARPGGGRSPPARRSTTPNKRANLLHNPLIPIRLPKHPAGSPSARGGVVRLARPRPARRADAIVPPRVREEAPHRESHHSDP